MTLPVYPNAISANNVNVELGLSGTTAMDLNQATVRSLFAVASGTIAYSDGHGKSNKPVITGGTIVDSGGYRYHFIDSTLTFTVTTIPTSPFNVEATIISGGGGGGQDWGGGGGGGGGYTVNFGVTATSYTIYVGAGGASGDGNDGGWSMAFDNYAWGGGGGGHVLSTWGRGGACGGGAGGTFYSYGSANGGTGSQGYRGGNCGYHCGSAGGGGMGGTGGDVPNEGQASNGGSGIDFYGTMYAAGGGGGSSTNGAGSGGNGGGGSGSSGSAAGNAGGANTGGGGGGGACCGAAGGAGGSGRVIIRYPY